MMNRLSRHYFITTILLLSVIFGAAPLHAADGQLEINQACAVNTGKYSITQHGDRKWR